MAGFEFWHHHGAVSVPDLDKAISWWDQVLGFKLERRNEIVTVPCQYAIVKNGNLRIEIFEVPGARAPTENRSLPDEDLKTWGNKHISFAVVDVPSFAEELRRRGANVIWVKVFAFGANIFITDNAGNLIEFVQQAKSEAGLAHL